MDYANAPSNPSSHWWLSQYDIPTIWEMGYTGKGVKIAVLDTGIALPHPDLNVHPSTVYDVTGCPLGTADVDNGHGTHCSGIIKASYNQFGVTGVSFDAALYVCKMKCHSRSTNIQHLTEGITWASAQGVRVISISQCFSKGNAALKAAIDDAISKNITVVCAAGNRENTIYYPAHYSHVISVAGVDVDKKALLSSQGTRWDIRAPGKDIYSTVDNGYRLLTGSSQAAPYVAGVVALMLEASKKKKVTPKKIKEILMDTAVNKIINPLAAIIKISKS